MMLDHPQRCFLMPEGSPLLLLHTGCNTSHATKQRLKIGPHDTDLDVIVYGRNYYCITALCDPTKSTHNNQSRTLIDRAIVDRKTQHMGIHIRDEDDRTEEESLATAHITELLDYLRDRAKNLLVELEIYKQHLKSIRLEASTETAHYHGQVRSELGMLERLASQPPVQSSYHIAKSSNLPFLESVWHTAKTHDKLTALQKRFFYSKPESNGSEPIVREVQPPRRRRRGGKTGDASCIVDAVVDGGHTWFKISLVSNTRLLFDLAKQGWEVGDSASDDDLLSQKSDDDEDLLPLVKTARELATASKATRVRTKHPRVKLILPRVSEGETKEIDQIITDCRATGIDVICQPTYQSNNPPIQDALARMAPSPFASLTSELNIDCTILLALVSEFSHAKVSKEPWFHTALQRQVEIEGNENLLPTLLYPAMGARKLVCTREATQRMQEIVDTIGTVSEKARTAIMMGEGEAASKTREELVSEMQAWSAYHVPSEWHLPIQVIEFKHGDADLTPSLPVEALAVCNGMTSINRSIFLYGWASGSTTITSNRTIVKQIESEFDKFDDVSDEAWPKIWLCPTARSLVGKEKRGAKKDVQTSTSKTKHDGAWPLPDPLKREGQRRNGLDVLTLREGHEVKDLRPDGYDYSDVLQAKNESHY